MTPEMIQQAVMTLLAAAATYGGIRADIKSMHEKIKAANDSAREAHQRIDRHLEKE